MQLTSGRGGGGGQRICTQRQPSTCTKSCYALEGWSCLKPTYFYTLDQVFRKYKWHQICAEHFRYLLYFLEMKTKSSSQLILKKKKKKKKKKINKKVMLKFTAFFKERKKGKKRRLCSKVCWVCFFVLSFSIQSSHSDFMVEQFYNFCFLFTIFNARIGMKIECSCILTKVMVMGQMIHLTMN